MPLSMSMSVIANEVTAASVGFFRRTIPL